MRPHEEACVPFWDDTMTNVLGALCRVSIAPDMVARGLRRDGSGFQPCIVSRLRLILLPPFRGGAVDHPVDDQ